MWFPQLANHLLKHDVYLYWSNYTVLHWKLVCCFLVYLRVQSYTYVCINILASKYLPRDQLIPTPNTKFRNLHCNIEQTTSSVVVTCTWLQPANVFSNLENEIIIKYRIYFLYRYNNNTLSTGNVSRPHFPVFVANRERNQN